MIANKCTFHKIGKSVGGYTRVEPGEHESAGQVLVGGQSGRLWPNDANQHGINLDTLAVVTLHLCRHCGCVYGVTK